MLEEIYEMIEAFRKERSWDKTDTPANMAKSIIIEAAELLENFQWSDEGTNIENIKEELADILMYTLTMCKLYNFDIKEIIQEKLEKNKIKYPVKK